MELVNKYYSGQGSLLVATRNPTTGAPQGFVRVGNVPALSVAIAVEKFEHSESESGNRQKDLTLIKSKSGTAEFTMESVTALNRALGFYGSITDTEAGTVTAEVVPMFTNGGSILANINVSDVTVKATAGLSAATWTATATLSLGAFIVPSTPNQHYYEVTTAGTTGASAPTFPVNGTTVTDGSAVLKDRGLIILVEDDDYTVNYSAGTLWASAGVFKAGESATVGYDYAAFTQIDAFTDPVAPIRWLRFEGLNTVDGTPKIVDIFKVQFDPVTDYSLINEELAQPKLTLNILADTNRASGSQFFRERTPT